MSLESSLSPGHDGSHTAAFFQLYGRQPTVTASAPGRVNLIGEHIDYNGGHVVPIALPQRTWVQLAPRQDTTVRAFSTSLKEGMPATFDLTAPQRGRGWLDYIQGVTAILRQSGHTLRGFDMRVRSDVPLGSGLSSSAALEVSLLRGLRQMLSLPIDDVQLARLGQRAENEFVGASVGIMDQMAASVGDADSALFLDTRDLSFTRVPLPANVDLLVVDSGVRHSHASGEYNTRRRECEQAAHLLGVEHLCDLTQLTPEQLRLLPDPLDRRARHVVQENQRVFATVGALRQQDLEQVGELLIASHVSLRDDYEVSVEALDTLVRLACADPAVYGARMTGGGFGGAIVALARHGQGRAAAARLGTAYTEQTGQTATVLVPPGQG